MKTILTITSAGLLHILPILCVATIACTQNEVLRAGSVSILCFAALGLGYFHGHHRTLAKPTTLKAKPVRF